MQSMTAFLLVSCFPNNNTSISLQLLHHLNIPRIAISRGSLIEVAITVTADHPVPSTMEVESQIHMFFLA